MTRRDEIIERLGNYNATHKVENEVSNLETFIDAELKKEENIIKFINSGTNGSVFENGLEIVDNLKFTNDVHKNLDTQDSNTQEEIKVSIGTGSDNVSYTIWSDNLILESEDASTEPWLDRVIAESSFDGELVIECPNNTNKYVALMLAEKMNKNDEFDSNGLPTVGNWSKAIQPNNTDNELSNYPIVSDSVSVRYDIGDNKVFMVFKLY